MSNTKHTPGPWEYRPDERLIWCKEDPTEEGLLNNLHVARVCVQPEAEANARLIAAAPELLDFAQMVAGGGWDLSDLMEEAREVIAKATQP